MGKTKIPYCDYTANPLKAGRGKAWKWGFHCVKCSPGCDNCYAESMNKRFGTGLPYRGRDDVRYFLDLSVFDTLPEKPSTVFVQNMSDLFLPGVPIHMIEKITEKPALTGHRILLLTKHPRRALSYYKSRGYSRIFHPQYIYFGLTVCNQAEADKKIPTFLKIPGKKWLSIEPMLGPVDLEYPESIWPNGPPTCCDGRECGCKGLPIDPPLMHGIDWIVVGCEKIGNKPGRPCDDEWVRSIVRQCQAAHVPVFVKQLEINGKVTDDMSRFPEDLRVRQYPWEAGR